MVKHSAALQDTKCSYDCIRQVVVAYLVLASRVPIAVVLASSIEAAQIFAASVAKAIVAVTPVE